MADDGAESLARARRGDVGRVVFHAGDHTQDVAIDYRVRQTESNAGDGGRGIVADAGQSADGLIMAREAAGRGDLLRGAAQIAGARIVSQAGPQREHVLFRRGGQRFHRGEPV